MKYRKLRIAWSAVWGVVAVLLIGLWVRSYSHEIFVSLSGHWVGLYHGTVMIDAYQPNQKGTGWIPVGEGFRFPNLFLISVCGAFAILPWLSSLSRLKRFSLRTLLIATTLVAIVLGLIVWLSG